MWLNNARMLFRTGLLSDAPPLVITKSTASSPPRWRVTAWATTPVSRAFCQQFFQWYNEEHRHSGLGLLTPAMVHFGQAESVLAGRQAALDAAYQAHPDRFVRKPPKPLPLPSKVWINRPLYNGPKTEEKSQ
jgi:putative transposase